MSSHSFLNGKSTSFFIPSQPTTTKLIDVPFDKDFNFNKVVRTNQDDPSGNIYSIDPNKILKLVSNDDLSSLAKITLLCRPDLRGGSGVAMWDTLFNQIQRYNLTACVMIAKPDYSPVQMNRVIMSSVYLDYNKPVSRIHLNKVMINDIIAIGLYDNHTHDSFVLLYDVRSICSVVGPENLKNDNRCTIPAVNCEMSHAIKVSANGDGTVLNMRDDDYDEVNAKPFVEWVLSSVNDISKAYPWKPHFLPHVSHEYPIDVIEDTLFTSLDKCNNSDVFTSTMGTYDDFEDYCRIAYAAAKDKRVPPPPQVDNNSRNQGRNKRRNRVPELTPLIELYTLDDYYLGVVHIDMDDDVRTVCFHKSTMGNNEVSEFYMSGKDLLNVDILEVSSIMLLSKRCINLIPQFIPDVDITHLSKYHYRRLHINF